MMFCDLLALLDSSTPCVWVSVAAARGSAPREVGAGMIVTSATVSGTIGGGHLELKAIELAHEWLRLGKTTAMPRHYPLGPALGQCCGGAVDLLFRPVTALERGWVEALAAAECAGGEVTLTTRLDQHGPHTSIDSGADLSQDKHAGPARTHATSSAIAPIVTSHAFHPWHVWIFGAGHTGKALAQVFGALPCEVTWVDSRNAEFPVSVARNVRLLHSDHPVDEASTIPPGADVLVLTHSHALDLEIVMQLVRRDDLAYVGVIGSATKAQQFRRRLEARGLDAMRLTCPIGLATMSQPGHKHTKNKHPGAIAVSVAAELLARRNAVTRAPAHV